MYKRYISKKQWDEMWETIQSYPKRVRDEIIQRMYEVAQNAIVYLEEYELESPIEQVMSVAIFDEISGWMDKFNVPINCSPQVEIEIGSKKYRVDFLISIWCMHLPGEPFLRIAVECDGHDFHERTKEQAKRDRSKDRALQSEGIVVLRFTGSEIYNDTRSCIWEIERTIKKLIEMTENQFTQED